MRGIADMMIAHQRAVITGLREQLTQANARADTNLRALNRISPLLAEAHARLAGKWISADQPPEMVNKIERDRLVYSDDVLIVNEGIVSIGSYGKLRDRAAAWSDKCGQKAEAVTLWQPLPAPPAAKEERE